MNFHGIEEKDGGNPYACEGSSSNNRRKLSRKLKISNKGFTQFVLDRKMMERGKISFGAVVWYGMVLF